MQFRHESFVKLFDKAPTLQSIVKPNSQEGIKNLFGQITKQLYGYLCCQGTKLSPAQVHHHLKDFQMLKNFIYWLKLDLWKGWVDDFTPRVT
jgi:hypothetical protein